MIYTKKTLAGMALSVKGPLAAEKLGITLCHEHCVIDGTCNFVEPQEAVSKKIANEPVSFENVAYIRYGRANRDNLQLNDENLSIKELLLFKNAGGNTIVDTTCIGLGRDPLALMRISSATGLNVIMGSGYYCKESYDLSYMKNRTEKDIAEEIIKDILIGVGDTGIHSGIIGEIGCGWPLAESEKKVLRGAGIAQKETGAALTVHPGRNENAPAEIVKILREVGTNLSRTVIAHVERTLFDPKNRYMIADAGCYLAYDCFGVEGYYPEFLIILDVPNDMTRIAQIKDLIEKGYGKQIVVSHDIDEKCRYMSFGGHGYSHMLNNVLPAMRRRGVTEDQINTILIENPRRLLSFN